MPRSATANVLDLSQLVLVAVVIGGVLVLLHPGGATYRERLRRDGRLAEAANLLCGELKRRGDTVGRLHELAALELALGREERAAGTLLRWARLDARAAEPRIRLGELALGRFTRAAAAGERTAAAAAGEEAARWLVEALAKSPIPAVRERLVEVYRWTGRPAAAAALLERAAALAARRGAADEVELLGRAVALYREAGASAPAIALLRAHLDRHPELAGELLELEIAAGELEAALPLARAAAEANPADREARLRLARLAEWTGRPHEAVDHYFALIRRDPGDREARERALALAPGLGRKPELCDLLVEIAPRAPGWTDLDPRIGELELALGRVDAAIVAYRRHLARHPGDLAARTHLAEIYEWTHHLAPALEMRRELWAAGPEDPGAGAEVARLELLAADYGGSVASYGQLLDLYPGRADLARDAAEAAEALWQVELAARAWGRLAELEPEVEENWFAWGQALFWSGDEVGEVDALRRGLEWHPRSTELAGALAMSLERQGRFAEAEPVLAGLAEAKPDDPWITLRLIRAELRSGGEGGEGRARGHLVALSRRDLDPETGMGVAALLTQNGERRAAINLLGRLARRFPDRSGLHRALASELVVAGEPAAALAVARDGLAAAPADRELLEAAADLALTLGRTAEALGYLERRVGAAPADRAGWTALARARAEAGDAGGARRAAGQAWALLGADPAGARVVAAVAGAVEGAAEGSPPALWLEVASLHQLLGRPGHAMLAYERMQAVFPGEERAALGLAELRLAAGDPAAAGRALDPLLARNPDQPRARYLRGVERYQESRFEDARHIFGALAQSFSGAGPNPYVHDWANSAAASGHWREALAAYEQVLEHPELPAAERRNIERARAALAERWCAELAVEGEAETRGGEWRRFATKAGSPVGDRMRLAAGVEHAAMARETIHAAREGAHLTLTWEPLPDQRADLELGVVHAETVANDDATWIEARLAASAAWRGRVRAEPELVWRQPDVTTLDLAALGGRRSTAGLTLSADLVPRRLELAARGAAERVELGDGARLGDGATFEGDAYVGLMPGATAELRLGLHSYRSRFARGADDPALAGLVPEEVAFDGAALHLIVEPHPALRVAASAGADYDRVGDRAVASGTLGLAAYPEPWLRLDAAASVGAASRAGVDETVRRFTFSATAWQGRSVRVRRRRPERRRSCA